MPYSLTSTVVTQMFTALVTIKFYIFYTFFDTDGVFHNLKKRNKTEVKINYEADKSTIHS